MLGMSDEGIPAQLHADSHPTCSKAQTLNTARSEAGCKPKKFRVEAVGGTKMN